MLAEERKSLHKNRVLLSQDWFGILTWPPFDCFGLTNMADMRSCENALSFLCLFVVVFLQLQSDTFFEIF